MQIIILNKKKNILVQCVDFEDYFFVFCNSVEVTFRLPVVHTIIMIMIKYYRRDNKYF